MGTNDLKRNATVAALIVRDTENSNVLARFVEDSNESMGLSLVFGSRYAGMVSSSYTFAEAVNRFSLSGNFACLCRIQ